MKNVNQAQQTVSRREKISKAGSTMFIAVAIAAVIVSVSAVSMKFLWSKMSYNNRVLKAKNEANGQLKTNLENIKKLSSQYDDLDKNPTADAKTILHALPPNYDYAALNSSMNSLAQQSGVQLKGGIGEDITGSEVKSAPTSSPQEIPLTINVSGNYQSIKQFITNLEHSIRPIIITQADYSGANNSLEAKLTANTYYQPWRTLDVTKSEVK